MVKIKHNLQTLYAPIKYIIRPSTKECFFIYGENIQVPLALDIFSKPIKLLIPTSDSNLRPHPSYLRNLEKISKQLPKERIIHTPSYLKTGQTLAIDLSAILSKPEYIGRSLRLKTSGRFIKLINLPGIIKNIDCSSYDEKILVYILDLDAYTQQITKSRLKELFLGYILYLISKDNFPFDELVVTLKKDNKYYSFLAYANGKFSIERLLSIIKNFQSGKEKDRIEKIEEVLPSIEKTVNKYIEDPEERNTIIVNIVEYLKTHPDEKIRTSPDAITSYMKNILKEEGLPTETSSFKKLSEKILEVTLPNLTVESTLIPQDVFSEVFLPEKILGNALNSREYLLEYGFDEQIKLLKHYYKQKYNIDLISVDENNVESNDIFPSDLRELTLTFKDGAKTFKLSVYVPKLTGNFFYLNGKKRSLLYQIFPNPIQNVKPFETLFKANYASIRFFAKTKHKHKGLFVYVVGQEVPFPIFMLGAFKDQCSHNGKICSNCIDFMFKASQVKYRTSETKPNTIYKFRFNNIWYYLPDNSKYRDKTIFWSFLVFYKKIGKELDTCTQLAYNIGEQYGGLVLDKIHQTSLAMFDPITVYVLRSEKLPTERHKLFMLCVDKTISGEITEQADITSKRLRNSEILNIILFKKVTPVIDTYYNFKKIGRKYEPKLSKSVIIDELLAGDAQSQFQIVDDNNPLAEASLTYRTTYSGYQGVVTENATPELRTVHPTQYCSLDPTDSPDSKAVGVIRHLAVAAELEKSVGKFKIHSLDEQCNTYSPSTLYDPLVGYTDGNRLQFVTAQLRSDIALKKSEHPFVASSYSNLYTKFIGNDFIVRTPITGKVTEITPNFIVIKSTQTNKQIAIPYNFKHVLESESTVTIEPKVTEGTIVKKNQIIAAAKEYFPTNVLSLGVNAHTGFIPFKIFNFEDGIVVSEAFAKKTTSIHKYKQVFEINPDDTLVPEPLPTIGEQIDPTKPAFKLAPKLHLESQTEIFNEFSEEDFSDIDISNDQESAFENEGDPDPEQSDSITTGLYTLKYFKKKGTVVDIEIYAKDEKTLKQYPMIYNLWKSLVTRAQDELNKLQSNNIDISEISQYYKKYLEPFGKTYKGDPVEGVILMYTIEYEKQLQVGDKIHNRHGNKGTITKILPVEEMPRTKSGKPLEVLINLVGVIGRKNAGQFLELYLGKVIHFINEKFKTYVDNGKISQAIALIIDMYRNLHPDKEYSKRLSKVFSNMSDQQKQQFVTQATEHGISLFLDPSKDFVKLSTIKAYMKKLGIPEKEQVYYKEIGKYAKEPVATGYMYWLKTKHMSSKKYHARSIGKRSGSTLQAAQGKQQEGGQRYSEMDIMNLYTYSLKNFMAEIVSLSSDDMRAKSRVINTIYKTGKIHINDIEQMKSTSSIQLKTYMECMGIVEPS